MEIDISKIIKIPSDTEIPVHNNSIQTKRPLCSNFPENSVILDNIEALKAAFDSLHVEECTPDIFKEGEYTTINSLEELKKFLSELLMRFDTSPRNYTKEDYAYLLGILYKSLIFIYENNPYTIITTTWLDPHSDRKVPSEKLVKEAIDALSDIVSLLDLNKQDKLIQGNGINLTDNTISVDLENYNQEQYFILDCGSSTKNI